jgi:peptidoglycan/LPS O-acetylase OafA/YrhL
VLIERGEQKVLKAALTAGACALVGTVFFVNTELLKIFLNPIWFEFLFGIIVFAMWRGGIARRAWRWFGIAGLCALGYGLYAHVIPVVLSNAIFDYDAGLWRAVVWGVPYAGLMLGLFSLGSMEGRSWRPLLAIGDASYSLYLIHMLVYLPTEYLLPPHFIPPDMLPFIVAAVVIMLALAIHRWVEKPLLDLLRRRMRSNRGPVLQAKRAVAA